jgi:hypothetical protein
LLTRLRDLPWAQYEPHREPAAERLGFYAPTIDWLTDHEEARREDPIRRARCNATLRSQRRETKPTPISRSWQFSRVGGMLHKHKNRFYGRVTIGRLILEWPLAVQDRTAAEAHVKSAIDTRNRVRVAAIHWRECLVGSREARIALAALSDEQNRYCKKLLAIGAHQSKSWGEAVKLLKESPSDETRKPNPQGATRSFVRLLRKVAEGQLPDRPLEDVERNGRKEDGLLTRAANIFSVSKRAARNCYYEAQKITGIRTLSLGGRPSKMRSLENPRTPSVLENEAPCRSR